MKIGDVIDQQGVLGVVRRLDRQARLAVVQRVDRKIVEIEDDLEITNPGECVVLHNPSEQWPFVKVPDRPRLGALVGLTLPDQRDLFLFLEWLPTEFGKTGAVFINPGLQLGYGDVLLVRHEKGTARLDIPRQFVTVHKKAEKPEPPPVPTAYTRLIIDPEDR